jgi:pilus assembly protein CpaB
LEQTAMRVATMISLGASALLGVGALFVAKVWLPGAADGEGGRAVVSQPAADTPVVVASEALPYGTKLEAKHLRVSRFPANAVPEGAFSTVEQVLAVDGGAPVVLTPVNPREPLLPNKISGPGARATVAALISPGMRAYTIRVSDVTGVGGHGLPGDRVDVILTRNVGGDDQTIMVSDVVVQNLRLLGIDLNADPTSNKPAAPTTATVEVDVESAQKLSVAANLGELSLALRRSGANEQAAVRPILGRDLGPVGAVVRTSAPAPASAPAAAAPPPIAVPPPPPPPVRAKAPPAAPVRPLVSRRPGSSIVIVHGDQAREVNVDSEMGG